MKGSKKLHNNVTHWLSFGKLSTTRKDCLQNFVIVRLSMRNLVSVDQNRLTSKNMGAVRNMNFQSKLAAEKICCSQIVCNLTEAQKRHELIGVWQNST